MAFLHSVQCHNQPKVFIVTSDKENEADFVGLFSKICMSFESKCSGERVQKNSTFIVK